ncbi:MAG: DUF4294 domain-containing protein [Paludibacteraceae bacterium]
MSKENRHKITAALSTTFIVLSIYATLNIRFMSFSSVIPLKTDEQEIDMPLDQLIEDLAEFAPLPDYKEENNTKATMEQPVSKAVDTQKEETVTSEQETPPEAITDKSEDNIVALPPVKIKEIKIEKSIVDSIVPNEILKIIEEQQLAKVVNKENNKHKNESSLEKYQFYRKNYKSIRNFLVAYPYALKTRQIIDSLNAKLAVTLDKAERKRLINQTEKQLFSQYESAIRKMTTSQGRVLLKMIARETNKSGYQIIKDFKGGFSATFWYAIGKLFSTDLKTEYHKEQEDSIYEEIINRYDSGEFK